MKKNHLTLAIKTAMLGAVLAGAPQAAAMDRPHIEPRMELRPVAESTAEYELIIYGDIGENWWGESVTAQSVAQQLNALDASVATINVRINSYGGSVADGLAIYNALIRHKATKAVTVDGVAMSSASLIAMAGDTVTMPATSILMIHAPWGGCYGNAKEMRQYADVLDKFSESMTDAYVKKSGMERAAVLSLLTDGDDHYYTGEEAIAAGFADAVAGDDGNAAEPDENARSFAASLLNRIAARCPPRYAALAVAAAMRMPPNTSTAKQDPAAEDRRGARPAANPNPPASAARTPPVDTGHTPGDTIVDEDQKKAAARAALAADKTRREAIRNQFAPFVARADVGEALATLQRECEDDHDVSVEIAGKRLLEALGKETTPAKPEGRNPDVQITRDETAGYRNAVAGALLHRANPAHNKVDDSARQFAGLDLSDLARDAVERAGLRTRGMSKREIAVKALQSTTDFPAILENVVTKTLRAGYDTTDRTFQPFCRRATLPDFKQISRVQLSGAPNLLRVLEGAEYEFGSIGDGSEKYAVQKYGRKVAITWEAIVNDDLDALTRIPQAFGASAAALESDIVYAILTGNPNMSDTVALFHATHGNLGTATALAKAIDATATLDPIAEAREKMLLQKGLEGRYITVRPQYLIVPPRLEKTALQLTGTNFQPARAADTNVFGSSLTPISEPRLQDASATAYYLAASPTSIDTIEYAYLQGEEAVFTETKNGFDVDGIEVKCRHVFGAKAIDWRGLFKNAGA